MSESTPKTDSKNRLVLISAAIAFAAIVVIGIIVAIVLLINKGNVPAVPAFNTSDPKALAAELNANVITILETVDETTGQLDFNKLIQMDQASYTDVPVEMTATITGKGNGSDIKVTIAGVSQKENAEMNVVATIKDKTTDVSMNLDLVVVGKVVYFRLNDISSADPEMASSFASFQMFAGQWFSIDIEKYYSQAMSLVNQLPTTDIQGQKEMLKQFKDAATKLKNKPLFTNARSTDSRSAAGANLGCAAMDLDMENFAVAFGGTFTPSANVVKTIPLTFCSNNGNLPASMEMSVSQDGVEVKLDMVMSVSTSGKQISAPEKSTDLMQMMGGMFGSY